MPERTTAARAVTENSKPTTKYTYDYDQTPAPGDGRGFD